MRTRLLLLSAICLVACGKDPAEGQLDVLRQSVAPLKIAAKSVRGNWDKLDPASKNLFLQKTGNNENEARRLCTSMGSDVKGE